VSSSTEAQRALVAHLESVLAADVRLQSVWLGGSFGRGDGDAWSDIDVIAVVDEEDRPACLAEYTGARNPVGETVLLMALFGRIAHAVRPDWERYDLLFVTPAEFRAYDRRALRPLAPASLDAPAADIAWPPHQPAPEALVASAQEFLRVLGLLPTAIGREEWLSSQEGAHLLRRMLIEMMIEANGVSRAERGGAKKLNPYLTPSQRASLEALAPPGADREALIAANVALARLFLPLAKEVLAKAGAGWPQALETATRAHLASTLAVTI
jgi:predicted nucleotidyltransferase